jgi:hypothetical protein
MALSVEQCTELGDLFQKRAKALKNLEGAKAQFEGARDELKQIDEQMEVIKTKKDTNGAPKKGRGRGRPKGSKNKKTETEVKVTKRGRPKGSKNKPKAKRGRPKGSKNKPKPEVKVKRGPGRPKSKRGPGRPKGSKNKKVTVAKNKTKKRPENELTMWETLEKVLKRHPKGANVEICTKGCIKAGYKSSSDAAGYVRNVRTNLYNMVKEGVARKDDDGNFFWIGKSNHEEAA